jgi:hypothetical protein
VHGVELLGSATHKPTEALAIDTGDVLIAR